MSIRIEYDSDDDVLVIEGVPYAAALFRALGIIEPGRWVRIKQRGSDGVLTLEMASPDAQIVEPET